MEVRVRKEEVDILETAVNLVRFLLKNVVWVILFPLIGLAVGYFSTLGKPPVYETQIVLKVLVVLEDEMSFLIQNYQRAGIPGLTADEQAEVKDFSYNAYTKQGVVFATITCVVGDTSIVKKIETGLVDRLNNEGLVKSYFEAFQINNRKILFEYKEKIRIAEAQLETRKEGAFAGTTDLMELHTQLGEFEMSANRKALITPVTMFKPAVLDNEKTYAMLKGLGVSILILAAFLMIKSFVIYYRKSIASTS